MGKALVFNGLDFSDVALDQVTIGDTVPCTAVALNQSSLTFAAVGDTVQLTAALTPSNTTDTLLWSSSDTNIATVVDGLVTIHGIGTATITATCGNASDTAAINQTSIKAQNALASYDGHAPSAYTVTAADKQILADSATSGQTTVGQAYNADDAHLHISGNTTSECIPVPYGATKALIHTSDGIRVQISYTYLVDTTDLVTFHNAQYPKYLSRTTFVKTDVGIAVEYGQAIVFRPTDEQTPTLDYVYFE